MLSTSTINNLTQQFISQYIQPSKEIYQQRGYIDQDLNKDGKIVQIPVRTKICKDHLLWSYDLHEIISEAEKGQQECRRCEEKFRYNDLVLDHYWYSLTKQFNKNCQHIIIIKDFCYQKEFRSKKYNEQLDKNRELIYSLYERRDEQNNFSKIFKQDRDFDQQLIEFQYQAVCLQDQSKLYLPVRFKECKHIGAYELSSLLCQFAYVIDMKKKAEEERKQQQIQEQQQLQVQNVYFCRKPGCGVKINYDLADLHQNLVLDYELLQAIKLAHPSTINFQIKNKQGYIQFEDEFTNEKDQFIKTLWEKMPKDVQNLYPSPPKEKIKLLNCYKEFFSQILHTFQRIFSNQDEEKVLKAFLLSFKYQTHNISLFDNQAQRVAEYPARCIECKDRSKCLDLRSLISNLQNQKLLEPEKLGILCPICSFNHWPKKKRMNIQIQTVMYIDNQLLAQMIRDKSYLLQNNILQYNGKKIMLEEYIANQAITIDQAREQSRNNNGILQYQSVKCNGTNEILINPLILMKCPLQNRFNFDYVYDVFKNSGFKSNELKICKCEVCGQKNQDIQDLSYDEFLASIIPKLPKNYDINLPFKYDTRNNEFIFEQQISPDIKPLPTPLVAYNKGFIDLKDDEEYQQLFKPRLFKDYHMQVNQRSANIGGITVTENADGRTIEGQDQKLKTMNEIAQQEKFAKWGLQVSDIQVKFIPKNKK